MTVIAGVGCQRALERSGQIGNTFSELLDSRVCTHTLPPDRCGRVRKPWREATFDRMRDRQVLVNTLASLRTRDTWTRRAVIVALGLLGERVPTEQAVLDYDDPADLTAQVLALRLAESDHDQYDAQLSALEARAKGQVGVEMVNRARMRIKIGSMLSVID